MPLQPSIEDEVTFRVVSEIGERARATRPGSSSVKLINEAGMGLTFVQTTVDSFSSRGKDGPTTHYFLAVLDASSPDELKLEMELSPRPKDQGSTLLTQDLKIMTQGEAISVPVVDRCIEKHQVYNGKRVVSAQTDTTIPGMLSLRPGDRLLLFCGQYVTSGVTKYALEHPALVLRRKPLVTPDDPFKEWH
jgi:hypothetical protein